MSENGKGLKQLLFVYNRPDGPVLGLRGPVLGLRIQTVGRLRTVEALPGLRFRSR